MSDIPDNASGYGAVIVAGLDEYQGFFIHDDKSMWREANTMMLMAMASGSHPIGALQAVTVEGVLTKNWPLVGAGALALSSITKMKFFVIKASKEALGTRSEMLPLKATTIEDARAEVNSMPEVVDLKFRLIQQMLGPKQ